MKIPTLSSSPSSRYNASMASDFAVALFDWYTVNKRQLPWRETSDPYAIWVSEVMLQQTRVETVEPFYHCWMVRFPNVHSLAEAEIEEVLRLWEGMGYYQRAHHLHKAAKILVKEYEGVIPQDVEEMQALPGIGSYTASAIAAFAYEADVIALDGNLRRVLSRLFDFDQNPRSPRAEDYLKGKALVWMPGGRASGFNQALMDLGALICSPRKPVCHRCPVSAFCLAFQRGVQEERPIRKKRRSIPHYTVAAGVCEWDGNVLIARRPDDQFLGGLWEFPGGKCKQGEPLIECLRREWREELGVIVEIGGKIVVFNHAYSHFRVTVHAFQCSVFSNEPEPLEHSELSWVPVNKLDEYPMGKVDREISKTLAGRLGIERFKGRPSPKEVE